jgi:hypothetical protein
MIDICKCKEIKQGREETFPERSEIYLRVELFFFSSF